MAAEQDSVPAAEEAAESMLNQDIGSDVVPAEVETEEEPVSHPATETE